MDILVLSYILYYIMFLYIKTLEFRSHSGVVDMLGGLHECNLIHYDFVVVPREYYAFLAVSFILWDK